MTDAPLMLSVSGARGIVGASMTPTVAARFAAAFGSYVCQSAGTQAPLLCLGRDSRPSGAELAKAAIASLSSLGCRVIDLGVVATPTVGVMIDELGADGGLVITASHNPTPWNGLKCLTGDGAAPPVLVAQEIIRRFKQSSDFGPPSNAPGPVERNNTANEIHVNRVLAAIDVEPIQRAKFRVVLDSVNGAGGESGRLLLEQLGCDIVHMNDEPTGEFAHPPEPTEKNLESLARRTAGEGAAIGFAQDPDADRLAIVDEHGRYIGEEYTLVLAARQVLQTLGSGEMATNLSTSRMIDDLAAQHHGSIVQRTAVGEANVVEYLRSARAVIGGEGNGGVIYPPVCWVRDSLSAMALVLGLLASENRRLSEIVADHRQYVMIKHSFDLSQIGGREKLDEGLLCVRDRFADAGVNTADGVRIDFADGWVHLRPSNTEPIVRLIAEADTDSRAWELIDEVAVAAGLQ